uniref:Protein toll-like n=1 Tax=Crassostrea virginica TaxID=6565 RepID=A0A8B8ESJ3_CRAVI|nr:protein toll-like [Crassostrea virginica]
MFQSLQNICLLVAVIFSVTEANIFGHCGIPKCLYRQRQTESSASRMMKTNDQPLVTKITGLSLIPPASNECYFNTADVVDSYTFDGNEVIAVLVLRCAKNYVIHLVPDTRPMIQNVRLQIQVENCFLTTDSLNTLSRSISISQVSFVGTYPLQKYTYCDGSTLVNSDCSYLNSTTAVAIVLPEQNNQINIFDLFQCKIAFPTVKELILRSWDLNQNLSILEQKFPNVQDLQISNSFLKTSPDFPWNNDRLRLDHNMSETELYESASRYHINIEANMHKRVLNLNANDIQTLVGFRFAGFLDMMKLSGNGLMSFSSFTFTGLRGLQHLDLSENYLTNIPIDSFRSLTALRHINLHANLLSVVSDDMFYYNTELVYLDLSNNSITMIGPKAFSRLHHLEELHLEYNRIATVTYSMLPSSSVSFKSLVLDGNPLKEFPDAVLYFKTLYDVSLRYTKIDFHNFTQMLLDLNFFLLADGNAQNLFTTEKDLLSATPRKLKRIDLTGSEVDNLHLKYFGTGMSARLNARTLRIKLMILLKYFQIIFNDNPIKCDCRINHLTRFIRNRLEDGFLRGNEYFFNDWKCASPAEFKYKPILQVPETETYCEVNIPKCPSACSCYERAVSGITIVDCRNAGFTNLPKELPEGIIDLWFQNNNITSIMREAYLPRTRQLLLTGNKHLKIDPVILRDLDNTRLKLADSNSSQ